MKKNPILPVLLAGILALSIVYGCSWIPMGVSHTMSAIAYAEGGEGAQSAVFAVEGSLTRPLFHSTIFRGSMEVVIAGDRWRQDQDIRFKESGKVESGVLSVGDGREAVLKMLGNFEEITVTGFFDGQGREWTLHAPVDTLQP
ncbi:hypothetical protein [Zongyangia hominis]|uniref:Uncharacterized protein n=1 Tax=Zongyangia hominis TaxID=2763677 RepID=A0A926EDV4_9FIRM|nr:hypothetical protein [Zongyangia hominis]MBC8570101.1 hypothetical protein [Zongyangia hominis]